MIFRFFALCLAALFLSVAFSHNAIAQIDFVGFMVRIGSLGYLSKTRSKSDIRIRNIFRNVKRSGKFFYCG